MTHDRQLLTSLWVLLHSLPLARMAAVICRGLAFLYWLYIFRSQLPNLVLPPLHIQDTPDDVETIYI